MSTDSKITCAHEGCSCTFSSEDGLQIGDKVFCSQGCADGSGCEHEDCACNKVA